MTLQRRVAAMVFESPSWAPEATDVNDDELTREDLVSAWQDAARAAELAERLAAAAAEALRHADAEAVAAAEISQLANAIAEAAARAAERARAAQVAAERPRRGAA